MEKILEINVIWIVIFLLVAMGGSYWFGYEDGLRHTAKVVLVELERISEEKEGEDGKE